MSEDVEAVHILQMLNRWAQGDIDEQQVHIDAEVMFEKLQDKVSKPSENTHLSIVYEILSQLSILNYQLITRDDIPVILQFLNTPLGQEYVGWDRWRSYWNNLDMKQRRRHLAANPYYATHPFPFERNQ
jgi:hypothetical protein